VSMRIDKTGRRELPATVKHVRAVDIAAADFGNFVAADENIRRLNRTVGHENFRAADYKIISHIHSPFRFLNIIRAENYFCNEIFDWEVCNMVEDKFANELMSDDELGNVAGGTNGDFKFEQSVNKFW